MSGQVESYAIEVEKERKRADIADEFIQSMGEVGVFLRSLPREIWKRFWDFLNESAPQFLPWVKEQGQQMERNWRTEQEKETEGASPRI